MATKIRVTCDGCPFDRTYPTAAKADWAYRLHSCDRQNGIAELAARGDAREAAVDRTPKPCLHKVANHQHGHRDTYVLDACRCLPCAHASSEYELNRTREHAYGRWNGLVDAEPARQHIQSLTDQGMGLKRIVAVSDLSQGGLFKLMYGKLRADGSRVPSKRITPDVERRILAVQLDLAHGLKIDGLGAARRVQALVAVGWSQSKICAQLGILPGNFTHIVHGRTQITRSTDLAIRALYESWSMAVPEPTDQRTRISVNRARNTAKRNGWAPPFAWDDDTIDDPDAVPSWGNVPALIDEQDLELDMVAVQRRAAGDKDIKVTPAEAAEVVRLLIGQGVTRNEIEKRTGLKASRYKIAA